MDDARGDEARNDKAAHQVAGDEPRGDEARENEAREDEARGGSRDCEARVGSRMITKPRALAQPQPQPLAPVVQLPVNES